MATYTSQYPPVQSGTYVKSTTIASEFYHPFFATDPTKPLTGGRSGNSWLASTFANQRFHIDLGSAKVIKRIYYENSHNEGADTGKGAENFTLWGSNSAGSFTQLTYVVDTGWTQLTVAQNTFNRHIAEDAPWPGYITVTNETAYRYYAFKFADNYSDPNYMGVRRIELQTENVIPTVTTQACDEIETKQVDGNGNITATGGVNCTRRGFCYIEGTSGDPTTANSTTYNDGDFGTGAFSKTITGLSPDTSYRVRAYAINTAGTGYGTTVQAKTNVSGNAIFFGANF